MDHEKQSILRGQAADIRENQAAWLMVTAPTHFIQGRRYETGGSRPFSMAWLKENLTGILPWKLEFPAHLKPILGHLLEVETLVSMASTAKMVLVEK